MAWKAESELSKEVVAEVTQLLARILHQVGEVHGWTVRHLQQGGYGVFDLLDAAEVCVGNETVRGTLRRRTRTETATAFPAVTINQANPEPIPKFRTLPPKEKAPDLLGQLASCLDACRLQNQAVTG